MSTEYRLLFDDDVYADMVQDSFNLSRWMNMDRVLARATIIPRSKKKLDELCRKGAVLIGDTLTMRMTGGDGVTIDFSATVSRQASVMLSRANDCYFIVTDRSIRHTIVSDDENSRPSGR